MSEFRSVRLFVETQQMHDAGFGDDACNALIHDRRYIQVVAYLRIKSMKLFGAGAWDSREIIDEITIHWHEA